MSLTKLKLIYDTWYHLYKWQPKIERSVESFSFDIEVVNLVKSLDEKLNPFKFKQSKTTLKNEAISKIQVWKKKNLNINRCIVLIEINKEAQITDLNLLLKN